ncbi:MAG: 23S rRNA (guanosine(2251)-2'-O)-methyltransferase RlmB [Vicinamibacterales bacterium]
MIIYGFNPVLEAMRAGRVREIRVAARADERVQALVSEAAMLGVRVRRVTREELDAESRRGKHQGVLADISAAKEATLEDLSHSSNEPALIVVLDEVEDPQNVGAILRSVDAAGATGVVRQERRAARLDGAAAKASAGAVHHVRVATVVNIARAIDELKAANVWTLGLDARSEMTYHEWDFTLPTALVVGAEGRGLRRLVRERCDHVISIPMRGHVDSLNVSAATAIVLFEAVRQRSRGRP